MKNFYPICLALKQSIFHIDGMSKGIPSTKARHGIYIDQPLMDAVKRDALKQRRSVNFIIGEALREKYGRAGHSTKGDHVVVYDRPAVDDDPGEDPGILG